MIKFEKGILIPIFILVTFSILALYSIGYNKPFYSGFYFKQFLWFIIGLILMFGVTFINLRQLYYYIPHIYIAGILLLIITLFIGKEVRGTRGWIVIGPIHFQSVEFVKIATILALARYFDSRFREVESLKELIIPGILVLLPVGLVLLQPDLGSALPFFPIFLVMWFISTRNTGNFIIFILIILSGIILPLLVSYYKFKGYDYSIVKIFHSEIIFPLTGSLILTGFLFRILYIFFPLKKELATLSNIFFLAGITLLFAYGVEKSLKTYQKKRLLVFIEPKFDPYGAGYNVIQSMITIGSGKIYGQGFLKGMQTQLGYLPEQHTDFIFAVIGEEFGWFGTTIVLLSYFVLIYNFIKIAWNARTVFLSLVASGITTMFIFNIFLNIGMCIGIMPITGLPLPFLSYGGSFMLLAMVSTGLMINIKYAREY